MARSSSSDKPAPKTSQERTEKVGTYIAYDAGGEEIWRKEGFTVHVDQVPGGISIGMKAGRVISGNGEILAQWDPWGQFKA